MKLIVISIIAIFFIISPLYSEDEESKYKKDLEIVKAIDNVISYINKQAQKSTVNITVKIRSLNRRLNYWKEYWRYQGRNYDTENIPQRGVASGIFLSNDGYLVTNYHVIEDAQEDSIIVTTYNGSEYYADIIGFDELTDIAVLRIYGSDFIKLEFAGKDEIIVGQRVIAVGSPLGLTKTITSGIISALERGELNIDDDSYTIKNYIQTDAAINPGNSGGGLFNLEGKVVGLITLLYSSTGYNIGYGFAIPAAIVKAVTEDLMDDGVISRGYVGIDIDEIDNIKAHEMGLDDNKGILITQIENHSPAEKANLKVNDFIVKVDDHIVQNTQQLQTEITQKRAFDTIDFTVIRDGENKIFTLVLSKGENNEKIRDNVKLKASLNFDLKEINENNNSRFKIEKVDNCGAAAKAGLTQNDYLIEINGIIIKTINSVNEIIGKMKPGDKITLKILRESKEKVIDVILHSAR